MGYGLTQCPYRPEERVEKLAATEDAIDAVYVYDE